MSPATLVFGILLGMLIAAPFTYIWTSRQCAKERTDLAIQGAIANVEKQIFALEGYIRGQDAALAEFKLEQIPLQTDEGWVRKRFYVTLRERLVYKGIPLPWWITKIPVGEKLDEASLIALAKAASIIVKSVDLKGLGIEIISRLLPKSEAKDSTTLQKAAAE